MSQNDSLNCCVLEGSASQTNKPAQQTTTGKSTTPDVVHAPVNNAKSIAPSGKGKNDTGSTPAAGGNGGKGKGSGGAKVETPPQAKKAPVRPPVPPKSPPTVEQMERITTATKEEIQNDCRSDPNFLPVVQEAEAAVPPPPPLPPPATPVQMDCSYDWLSFDHFADPISNREFVFHFKIGEMSIDSNIKL